MRFSVQQSCDAREWDAFVSQQIGGHYMQSYAWGQFQKGLGWQPYYCMVRERDVIRASALVLTRRLPGTRTLIACAPRGPVVKANDVAVVTELVEGIRASLSTLRCVFLRFDPYWRESESSNFAALTARTEKPNRDWSYWNGPRFVFWLDLAAPEADLMKATASTCRNEIRRGYRSGVSFELGSKSDVEPFFDLMTSTGSLKGIAFHDKGYYERLIEELGRSTTVQLFYGRFEGRAVTTGISVAYGAKAWLLYAASSPAHYKLRANRTQQWEMIKWAKSLGCIRYDFRGTATNDPPDPKDPGYGVYEFKKSFGPQFTRLDDYSDLVLRPTTYRGIRIAEEHLLPAAYRMRTWLQR